MTIHELLNIRLDATGVTDMLKWLNENDDKGRKTGVDADLAVELFGRRKNDGK